MKIGQEVKAVKQFVYGAGHPQGGRNALIVGAKYRVTDFSWSMSTFAIVDIHGNKLWFNLNNEHFEMEKKDAIVESVVAKYLQRSKLGIKKYGTTLEENNVDNFLSHLQEELFDASLYIEKLLSQRNGTNEDKLLLLDDKISKLKK
jgi:hypothetical protein